MLQLSHGTLRFSLVADGGFAAPAFDGSMLRGAFGHALRRLVCVMRRRSCEGCPLSGGCLYIRLFETRPAADEGAHISRPPHPYVIAANLRSRRGEPTKQLDFAIRLFGRALGDAPFVARAIEEAAARGLGRERTRFRLARILANGAEQSGYPTLAPEAPPPPAPRRARLRFVTPLRIEEKGRPLDAAALDGPALGRALIRRARLMSAFHGEGGPAPDRARLAAEAERLRLEDAALAWRRLQRHSSRQKARQAIGGIVGEATLDFSEAPALQELAGWLPVMHLGKGTSMGLGRVEIAGDG